MATIFPTTTLRHDITVTDHETDALTDADSLAFTVTLLGSVGVTYTYGVDAGVVRVSTGTYTLTYDVTAAGAYSVVGVVVLDDHTRTLRINYVITAT